jgi:starvation-inducible DNA-binding protein
VSLTTADRTAASTTPDVIAQLQSTLVELIDLSLLAKQAHWNVAGPLFKPVHEELDVVVDICRTGSDEVAERIATLGEVPDGRAQTVAQSTPFRQPEAQIIPTQQAVALIGGMLDELSRRLHERISALADPDPVSQGILITIAEQIEKQAWMLRKQTP